MFLGTRRPDFNVKKFNSYDSYWNHRGWTTKIHPREKIINSCIPDGSSVLIVGCGFSALPFLLKKRCKLTVSDISPVVVTSFRNHGIESFVMDLENIPVLSQYDIIIASEVLEHIKEPEEVIRILSKYTKRFLISVPNSAFYRYRFHLMFAGRFMVQWTYHPSEHLRFWSHRDFVDWLDAMNLELVTSYSGDGSREWIKNLLLNLFAHQIVYDCLVKSPSYSRHAGHDM